MERANWNVETNSGNPTKSVPFNDVIRALKLDAVGGILGIVGRGIVMTVCKNYIEGQEIVMHSYQINQGRYILLMLHEYLHGLRNNKAANDFTQEELGGVK